MAKINCFVPPTIFLRPKAARGQGVVGNCSMHPRHHEKYAKERGWVDTWLFFYVIFFALVCVCVCLCTCVLLGVVNMLLFTGALTRSTSTRRVFRRAVNARARKTSKRHAILVRRNRVTHPESILSAIMRITTSRAIPHTFRSVIAIFVKKLVFFFWDCGKKKKLMGIPVEKNVYRLSTTVFVLI